MSIGPRHTPWTMSLLRSSERTFVPQSCGQIRRMGSDMANAEYVGFWRRRDQNQSKVAVLAGEQSAVLARGI